MKNRRIITPINILCTSLCLVFLSFSAFAQSDIEIEDGKLKVYKINGNAEIEVATSGANADASIQFGDDSTANEVSLGWDGGDEMFKLSLAQTFNNFGLNIKEVSNTSRFGFGNLPDDNAKLFVNHNSSYGATPAPHLLLQENNSADFARLQFGQFNVSSYWQVAAKASSDAIMDFYHFDGTSGENVLTLDADDGSVAINNGRLKVDKTNTNAIIEIATTSNSHDAVVKFGEGGNANDATMGFDGIDDAFKISMGSQLGNDGITVENLGNDNRIGMGALPDPDAKVIISHNSAANLPSDPHLRLEENNSGDLARLEFGNFDRAEYWHMNAGYLSGDPKMNFMYHDGTSGDLIVTIDGDDGRVGIQRSPSMNAFEVEGDASKSTAGDWLANSDRRIKTDVRKIDGSWKTLMALRPVKFKYTEEWRKRNPDIKNKYYYNFIAQEYAEVFPESAQGSGEYLDGDDQEILQIDTYNAQIVHLAATQKLINENQKLKEELASLQKQLASFASQLSNLRDSNAVSNDLGRE